MIVKIAILCILCVVSCMRIYLSSRDVKSKWYLWLLRETPEEKSCQASLVYSAILVVVKTHPGH